MTDLREAIDHILQTQVAEDDYAKGALRFFLDYDPYGDRAQAVAKILALLRASLLSDEAVEAHTRRVMLSMWEVLDEATRRELMVTSRAALTAALGAVDPDRALQGKDNG